MYEFIYTELKSKSINDNYVKRYVEFIKKYNGSGTIKHHALPKAPDMFPKYKSFDNYSWNCIYLGKRHHFLAHWMLWKAMGKSQTYAFYQMRHKDKQKLNSKTYSVLLKNFRVLAKDEKRRKKLSRSIKKAHENKLCGMYGKSQSDYQKNKLSNLKKGVPLDPKIVKKRMVTMQKKIDDGWVNPTKGKSYEELYGKELAKEKKLKISKNHHDVKGNNNPMYGKAHKNESKEKMKTAALNVERLKCKYCGVISNPGNYKRWHGENCKHK